MLKFRRVAAAALGFGLLASTASAQGRQPTKPLELVVTAGAGGGTDTFARTAQAMIMHSGSLGAFWSNKWCGTLMTLGLVVLAWPLLSRLWPVRAAAAARD